MTSYELESMRWEQEKAGHLIDTEAGKTNKGMEARPEGMAITIRRTSAAWHALEYPLLVRVEPRPVNSEFPGISGRARPSLLP